jgi:hypothetical protein
MLFCIAALGSTWGANAPWFERLVVGRGGFCFCLCQHSGPTWPNFQITPIEAGERGVRHGPTFRSSPISIFTAGADDSTRFKISR